MYQTFGQFAHDALTSKFWQREMSPTLKTQLRSTVIAQLMQRYHSWSRRQPGDRMLQLTNWSISHDRIGADDPIVLIYHANAPTEEIARALGVPIQSHALQTACSFKRE